MTSPPTPPVTDIAGVELGREQGLDAVRVATSAASGLVFLQGAHLAAWQPAGHEPVIFMSPRAVYARGKALRGGVPICFPWFGPHREHPEYPAHGFARTTEFTYRGSHWDELGRAALEFELKSSDRTRAYFPHEFTARVRIALGATLGLELHVENNGEEELGFEEALHTYFAVGDVTRVRLLGLQGATYTDKVRARATFREASPELGFAAETDRVYESPNTCTLIDPAAKRSIRIEKSHSAETVVWNPWNEKAATMTDLGADAWPEMLCVESANVGSSRIHLRPGEAHGLKVTVSLASGGSFDENVTS